MVAKILCVAEKPSIAKAVASHLAGGQVRRIAPSSSTPWLSNYEFDYSFPAWGQCKVIFTSVAGHLQSIEFEARYRSWQSCSPVALFEAETISYIEDRNKDFAKNIEQQARYARALFIWTDCDREGEAIGAEIRAVAAATNDRLGQPANVFRARFSNIERQHIIHAAMNPIQLDERMVNAVNARIELDFRIGTSFTRMQTLNLQSMIGHLDPDIKVLSYGSCQFPTLGFVVDRYFQVQKFVPEPFWSIKVMYVRDDITVKFNWARNHLFDRMVAIVLLEQCLIAKTARVTLVQTKPTSKWKPLPLTTVELQKMGSRYLRIDSHRIMLIAESLYQKGFISYPRTETDQFDEAMDLRALVGKQTQSETWGTFAQGLLDGAFGQPRDGRNNDKAHPPIHPISFVNPSSLEHDDRRVYEFVARRFLACCSQDALGSRSEVEILYGSETFKASGLAVIAKNYLDVYPYEKWTSTEQLPDFRVGETFEPTEARLAEGKTAKPGYLTEPDLIALMDANGIGTDATLAEHIEMIQRRNYVETRGGRATGDSAPARGGRSRGRGGRGSRAGEADAPRATGGPLEFIPTTLGVALYEGYEKMGFETSLTKPFLRKEMEMKMKAICDGRMTRPQVVQESLHMYKDLYIRSMQSIDVLKTSVRKYVLGQAAAAT